MKTAISLIFFASTLYAADGEAVSCRAGEDFPLSAGPASPSWKDIRGVTFEQGRYGERIPGFLTEVRSRWTEGGLYFPFTCPCQTQNLEPGPPAAGETNGLWKWDVAEVFIGSDFGNIRRYKEFEVSPRGEWIDLSIELDPGGKHQIDWQWNSGFANKTRTDERQRVWHVEMRIPMASNARVEARARSRIPHQLPPDSGPCGPQKLRTHGSSDLALRVVTRNVS
jgi:hypothetical protein